MNGAQCGLGAMCEGRHQCHDIVAWTCLLTWGGHHMSPQSWLVGTILCHTAQWSCWEGRKRGWGQEERCDYKRQWKRKKGEKSRIICGATPLLSQRHTCCQFRVGQLTTYTYHYLLPSQSSPASSDFLNTNLILSPPARSCGRMDNWALVSHTPPRTTRGRQPRQVFKRYVHATTLHPPWGLQLAP